MHRQTAPLQPIEPAYQLRILTDEKSADLRSLTLKFLEETGIRCPTAGPSLCYMNNGKSWPAS